MFLLQATATAVWEALQDAPAPEDLGRGARVTLAAKLKPHRCALHACYPRGPCCIPCPQLRVHAQAAQQF